MFDNPIFFLILISLISAISEWLGKRRKAKAMREEELAEGMEPVVDRHEEAPVGESRRTLAEQKQDWEERLRRMLEGDAASEESRPPAVPKVEPAAREGSRGQPTILEVDEPFIEPVRTEIPVPPVAPPPVPQVRPKPPVSRPTGTLRSSGLRGVKKGKVGQRKKSPTRRPAPMITQLRSRNAIRQAIVASVILGAPKGTGEESDLSKL